MAEIAITVIINDPESDSEHLDLLTNYVARDLREIGAADVQRVAGQAPPGAKGDPLTLGMITLTVFASLLPNALDIFHAVTDRGAGRSVTLKMANGREIVLEAGDNISAEEFVEMVARISAI